MMNSSPNSSESSSSWRVDRPVKGHPCTDCGKSFSSNHQVCYGNVEVVTHKLTRRHSDPNSSHNMLEYTLVRNLTSVHSVTKPSSRYVYLHDLIEVTILLIGIFSSTVVTSSTTHSPPHRLVLSRAMHDSVLPE